MGTTDPTPSRLMDVGDAGMAKMLVTISDIGSRHDFTTFILHLFDICIHHQHLEDVQRKFYISHQHRCSGATKSHLVGALVVNL